MGLYARHLIVAGERELAELRGALKSAIRDRDQHQRDKRRYEGWLSCAEAQAKDLQNQLDEVRRDRVPGPEAA
jgi:hypothetical protein